MTRSLAVSLAAALALAPAVSARAQARPAAAARGGTRAPGQDVLSVREAREALRSTDPDRIIQGIDSLTVAGTDEAVTAIVELLRAGPIDRVTDYAVEKLGIIGRPSAIEELSNLTRHRRPAVRRAALNALAQIRDDRVRALLEGGLHDSDGEVRAEAAESLGAIGARAAVPLLFRAFERGVPEAAEAIGRLAEPAVAVSSEPAHDREDPRATSRRVTLAMWLGRAPLSVLLRGFEQFLNRRDVPVPLKVQIITRLEQQASAQVRDFLQRWVQHLPASYRGPDRARAELAIRQIRVPTGGAQ